MRTVWKFPLLTSSSQIIEMPLRSNILSVQMQAGRPYLWALVHPYASKEQRKILILGTGHPTIDEELEYISTFQIEDGQFVFHVFEMKEG